ncbi:MAG: cytochrome c-type biogenesis protein [Pseudomonadota bacterium]
MRWLAVLLVLMAEPVSAVEPDEILQDPALEERARELSKELRCPVCRNESIDESSASIAKDIRVLLRERLVAGDTDEQAVQFLVDRYGEFVLFSPPAQGANLILYFAAPVLLVLSGATAAVYLRRRAKPSPAEPLSEAEKARVAELLKE